MEVFFPNGKCEMESFWGPRDSREAKKGSYYFYKRRKLFAYAMYHVQFVSECVIISLSWTGLMINWNFQSIYTWTNLKFRDCVFFKKKKKNYIACSKRYKSVIKVGYISIIVKNQRHAFMRNKQYLDTQVYFKTRLLKIWRYNMKTFVPEVPTIFLVQEPFSTCSVQANP